MGERRIWGIDPDCLGCYYYRGSDTVKICEYHVIADRKRPCPPGQECTVKDTERGALDKMNESFERYEARRRKRAEAAAASKLAKQTVKEMIRAGKNPSEIAKATGRKLDWVMKQIDKRQNETERRSRSHLKFDLEAMKKDWKAGERPAKLAEKYHITEATAFRWQTRWTREGEQRAEKRTLVQDRYESLNIPGAKEDWKNGMSHPAIAQKYGVTQWTIRQLVKHWKAEAAEA